MEWQTIDSAPFGDTYVLVLLNGKFARVAYHYSDGYGRHVSSADAIWANEYDDYASHWMPLPEPPK